VDFRWLKLLQLLELVVVNSDIAYAETVLEITRESATTNEKSFFIFNASSHIQSNSIFT